MMKLYGGDTDSNQNKNESTNNETSGKGLIFSTLKLFKRWKFLLSFLLNQLGSVTFVWTLASTNAGVSTIIPVTNGLKFFITYLAGKYICQEKGSVFSVRAFSGLSLIGLGVILQLLNL